MLVGIYRAGLEWSEDQRLGALILLLNGSAVESTVCSDDD